MPENLPRQSNERKIQSASSWDPSPNTPAFQPMVSNKNPSNAMSTIHQAPQQQFTIGEWNVPTDTSAHATPEGPQQPEEDLHQQWEQVSRNWRESSVQSGTISNIQYWKNRSIWMDYLFQLPRNLFCSFMTY